MRTRFTYDQLIGVILFVFSLALYFIIIPYEVEQISERTSTGLNPAFMPELTAFVLAFLSLLLIVKKREALQERVRLFPLRVIITILLFIAYMVLTPLIGYLPATFLILPIYLLSFGMRRWKTVVVLSIIFPFILYLFFAKVMLVMLPRGVLFN
ncbi:MAG: tripartite tricarboxylate transporter TctB family protein [Deltaproteobacteria bacterium]|nr:tripartite tricarboxylate transporter TctB family protein [Deltaproteobacteria bacterium]